MTELSKGEITELWRELRHRSWQGLHDELILRKATAESNAYGMLDAIDREVDDLRREGRPFPKNAEGLYEILAERIAVLQV